MFNSRVTRGSTGRQIKLPKGVNQREKAMFVAFAKSVNQDLFKV